MRLLAASALRHLQQKKPHLAGEKLAELAALPQSLQGDRPAFLAALRYMVSTVRGSSDEAVGHRAEVERVLGNKVAAGLLISGVAHAAKQGELANLPPVQMLGKAERASLPETVIRVVELAKDMQMGQTIPADWMLETGKQFRRSSQSLNVGQLQTLGEASLLADQAELAYAISVAGLQRGGSCEANFLLLRAQSMLECLPERWAVCAVAAAELARKQRLMDVVDKAVELVAETPFNELSLTAEQVATVVQKEKAEPEFPTPYRVGPDYSDFVGGPCQCPDCRAARGEGGDAFDDFDDFDEPEDEDDFEAMVGRLAPPDMPPEIARMVFEEAKRAVQRGESLDSMLNRVFGPGMGSGGRRKKGRRK